MNTWLYIFHVDEGVFPLTHKQYMEDTELRRRMDDATGRAEEYHFVDAGLTILLLSHKRLRDDKEVRETVEQLEFAKAVNPLQFFCPTTDEGLAFINDDEHSVTVRMDGNRRGKTTDAYVKLLVGVPLIQCDAQWPIFTQVGVKYRRYLGPKKAAMCTYNLDKVRDPLWKEMVSKWTPDDELGVYSRTNQTVTRKEEPPWEHQRMFRLRKSRSEITMFTYEQEQTQFEGPAFDAVLWDEQGRLDMFNGLDRGCRTRRGRHFFSMTPHNIPGRPDTGGTWWGMGMVKGDRTYGHTIALYRSGDIRDVPDWIYPESEKLREIQKWETEPREKGDRKALAEGRARLYGEPHVASGLIFEQWDRKHNLVDLPWDKPPAEYSLYRGVDHGGNKDSTVCLYAAVTPDQDVIIYREYYAIGKTVSENVGAMIDLCGNTRKELEPYRDPQNRFIVPVYEEEFVSEGFWKTAMDSRSFSYAEGTTGKPYGWLYQKSGLRNVIQASGKARDHWVSIVNEMLRPDPNRKHFISGEKNGSRLYVASSCKNLIREIESWTWRQVRRKDGTEKWVMLDSNDHGPSALGYLIQIPPRFLGNVFIQRKLAQSDPNNYWADPLQKRRQICVATLGYRAM